MSDPVTNVEIEDVLSSIRRLVSNESRGGDMPPETVAEKPGVDESARLVLTPSFRVDEAAKAAAANAEAEDEDVADDWTEVDSAAAAPAAEDDVSEENWPTDEMETADDEADDAPETGDDSDALISRLSENEDEGDASLEAEAEPEQRTERTARPESFQARVAELEEVVARRSEQWEPDGTSADDYSGGATDPLPWEDYVPGDVGGDADGAHESDAHVANEDRPTASAPEPKPEPREDVTDTPPEAEASDDRLDASGFEDTGDDAVLDEDALRDLVADIVRQELQGALGERITRNVRKLVRREIHRALASQELD